MPIRNRWWELLFGGALVDRRAYACVVGGLVAFHCAYQIAAVWYFTGEVIGPLAALNPLLGVRLPGHRADGLVMVLLLETLAVASIGASVSMRRAIHVGMSAWAGLLFLIPVINVVLIGLFALAPRRNVVASPIEEDNRVFLPMFVSASAGTAAAVVLTVISVYGFAGYGAGLFVLTPFTMGVVVGYLFNRNAARRGMDTVVAVSLSMMLTFGGLILFAMEGAICILMAAPMAIAFAIPGGLLGRMIAQRTALTLAHVGLLLLALPLLMGAEKIERVAPLHEVVSTIEIDAPPDAVWPHVIGFTDLPPPSEVVFKLGIAYPVRARIDGRGVGAVRHCEFSTGPFVEPITRWEEATRLSFDVVGQPHPLHEWSPYENVHAPHLVGNMRSKRGEFRLVPLAGGRTRLEGSTWYELEMFPQTYWTLWSDGLVHAIHTRVLAHIKRLAESGASAG